jgi:hypothetical protein
MWGYLFFNDENGKREAKTNKPHLKNKKIQNRNTLQSWEFQHLNHREKEKLAKLPFKLFLVTTSA